MITIAGVLAEHRPKFVRLMRNFMQKNPLRKLMLFALCYLTPACLKRITAALPLRRLSSGLVSFQREVGQQEVLAGRIIVVAQLATPDSVPFFDYSPEIRKVGCATNTIGSINMNLRKVARNQSPSPVTRRCC
jgi:hypothetical protein